MPKINPLIALDIGSGSIKALAVHKPKKESELEVLGFVEESSFGVRRGVVVDPQKVAEIIQESLRKLQEQIKQRCGSVYINLGGSHIFSFPSRGLVSVSRADGRISEEDIKRVFQQAEALSLPPNREVLEVFPKEFFINGEGGIKEPPLGLQGIRLEADVLVLGYFAPYFKNLTSSVLGSHLQIDDVMPSPLASAAAVLTPREKELGVVLLDIGAGTTDFAVFEEGSLAHLTIFPFGSSNITKDIAIFLKTDMDVAERIKIEFGTLSWQGSDKKEKIKLGDDEVIVFSHKKLSKVIEDRVAEMFNEINKELKKIAKQGSLPAGVVLTGGGSKLPKIKDFAKKELKLPCRIGRPRGFSPNQEDPRLAVVCGLALTGFDFGPGRNDWQGSFPSIPGKGLGSKIKKLFKIFIP